MLLAAMPTAAAAEDITIALSADVATVSGCTDLFGVAAGDTISATYTYDLTIASSGSASTVGDYWHYSGPYGIIADVGGTTFQTSTSAPEFLVELVNDHPAGSAYARDNYLLRSYVNEPIGDASVDHISWQLDDDTMTALDSIDLQTTAPVVADWQSVFGFNIDVTCVPECPFAGELDWLCDLIYPAGMTESGYLRAHVTSAEVVETCSDSDGDGFCDEDDNCPSIDNADQTDSDADSAGDACDVCPLDADDDADDDGVCGDVDDCAETASGDVIDDAGCSVADYCPCDADIDGDTWKNHGKYVSCVSNTGEDFVDSGLLTQTEADDIQSDAGSSECGHKNK